MTAQGLHPARARRSGSFVLDLKPNDAFLLFTAEGERAWVPGWSPSILGSGRQEAGLVFLTDEGEYTIWTVIESDEEQLRHRYSRVTPSVRAGIVEVRVVPEGSMSRVIVSYDMTALPGAGAAALEPYSTENFHNMLDEWRSLIEQALHGVTEASRVE
jgi:hypothetical protein